MRWNEEDWKRENPESSDEFDILHDILGLIDEQALGRELQEFIEESQTDIIDDQHEGQLSGLHAILQAGCQTAFNSGQCWVQQNPLPAALHDHTYAAQEPLDKTAFTPNVEDLKTITPSTEAEYWCPQNPGPLNVTPVPNVVNMQDAQNAKRPTFTPLTNAAPAMTYGIPMYSQETNTDITFNRQKAKKIKEEKVEEGPYIKKPLNAFMIYIKCNRKSAEAELGVRTSAVVNKYLGERWKSLSPEEREIYINKAKEDAQLHSDQNPGWTNKINYRHRKKRSRTKVVCAEMFVSPPQHPSDLTQQTRTSTSENGPDLT
uniref:HMG box domain-containing protein n=1 Tax=Gouania willdenowi TaxID=441366 RepID=A0A8C5HL80_GOUWI